MRYVISGGGFATAPKCHMGERHPRSESGIYLSRGLGELDMRFSILSKA